MLGSFFDFIFESIGQIICITLNSNLFKHVGHIFSDLELNSIRE
jgi:hypothetical protein